MISIDAVPEGKVVAVCANPKHRFSKTPCLSIKLVAGTASKGTRISARS